MLGIFPQYPDMDSGKDDYTFVAYQHSCMNVQIEPGWKKVLDSEFSKPYFLQIVHFLKTEKNAGKTIYPPGSLIFNAFNTTPFERVKVVLLGQDPYHGLGTGTWFKLFRTGRVRPPPSLQNIFKELQSDIGLPIPPTGNLTPWAAGCTFAQCLSDRSCQSAHESFPKRMG